MPGQTRRRLLRAVVVATAAAVTVAGPAAARTGDERPDFEAPFVCGQSWEAGTRPGHSPSWYSVDFNREDDYQAPVLASAPGVVTAVEDVGDTSYGKYVVVDHGREWTTLYAHLDKQYVKVGQWLDQGDLLGLLGTSGGSTGPHLHFEERLDRVDKWAYFHDKKLAYDTTIRSHNCGDTPITGDWNGDRITDVGTFGKRRAGAMFRRRLPTGEVLRTRLGNALDIPVVGDWNGDGQDDLGTWNRMTRTFVLGEGNRAERFRFGVRRDRPVVGDWDGDRRSEVGVYRSGSGVFRLRDENGFVTRFRFGGVNVLPVTGDWNGDGRTDVGVFAPATGTWTLRAANGATSTVEFGARGIPVSGDWNGDGRTDVGVWRPARGVFDLRATNNQRLAKLDFGRPRG